MKQLADHTDKEAIVAAEAFECGVQAVKQGLINTGEYNGPGFALVGFKDDFIDVANRVGEVPFERLAEDAPIRTVLTRAWVDGFYNGVDFGETF